MIFLPTVNACFNALSAVLLGSGFVMIRKGKIKAHMLCMLGALGSSTIFLIGYLVHHASAGITRYQGVGVMRTTYLTILATHTVLAVVILPLIARTLYLAAKGRFDQHRAIARWTLPLWFYVSVTGVVIYGMLYGI